MNMTAEAVKRAVSSQQAALAYGIEINRKGFAKCPFHSEKTASLKFFPDGGFKCFGCGAAGSVIDFTMQLFDLGFRETVTKLDYDFNLGLSGQKPSRKQRVETAKRIRENEEKERLRAQYELNMENIAHIACEGYLQCKEDIKRYAPKTEDEPWDDRFCLALKEITKYEYIYNLAQIEVSICKRTV